MKRKILGVSMMLSACIHGFGARNHSQDIHFGAPIRVGNTVLQEGDYKMVWDRAAIDVLVAFMQDGRVVCRAAAKTAQANNHWDTGTSETLELVTKTERGLLILEEVELPHMNLFFDPTSPSKNEHQYSLK